MKAVIFVALAIVALVAAAPAEKEPSVVKILRSEFEQQPAGGYVYSFESDDGTSRVENGEVKQVLDEEKKPHEVIVVRGSFSYVNSDGKTETVNYVADETGFHAEGDSIPKVA